MLIFSIGVVSVADFQEDDPEQTYIPRKSFYRRFTVEPKARKLLVTSFLFSQNFSLFTTTFFPSPNLDQKHVFVRPLTYLKT
jgi:hypothetical protein